MDSEIIKLRDKYFEYDEKYHEFPDLLFINAIEFGRLFYDISYRCHMGFPPFSRNLVEGGTLYIFNCLIIPFRSRALTGNMFAENRDLKGITEISPRLNDLDTIRVSKLKPIYKIANGFVGDDPVALIPSDFHELTLEVPVIMIKAYQREMKRLNA